MLYQDATTAEVVQYVRNSPTFSLRRATDDASTFLLPFHSDKESITSKLSQTFWAALRASGTFSGGTLVYRGWDAVRKSGSDAADPSSQVDLEEGVEIPVKKVRLFFRIPCSLS